MGKINSVICNLTNLKNLFNGFNNITYESNATIEKPQVNNVTSIDGKEVELMDLSVDNNSNDNNIAMKALKNYGDNLRDKAETVGSIADTTAGALRTGIGEIVGGWAYVTGNMSSQDVDSVMADIKQDNKKHTITNALTNVVDTVEGTKQDTLNTAIDVTKDFTSTTKDVLTGKMSVSDYYEKTEATKINLSVGIVEGVGNWGEKIYDTINLKSNYYIGKADVALGIRTQEQFDENMARVKEQVATDQTKYIYDWFYGDTKVGQNIQEKSFATNEVRTTGNMAGEVGMNIGMAYVGGELVGSSSVVSELGVSGQKAAQIGSKVFAASSAGATGYGEAASKAYQNGATIEQGMIAGEVNGAVRAAQYAIGGKINETNPFANQVSNSALHVGLDAVDGASDALIQPAVELIYKDGTYDTNGNYVKFDETESITSKYSKVFNENGGWNTVINSAKTGAIFSAASEAGGVAKYFKYDDNGATKNAINSVENTKVTNIDENTKFNSKNPINEISTKVTDFDTDVNNLSVKLYEKGYNVDEINQIISPLNSNDVKNYLNNIDDIPNRSSYVSDSKSNTTNVSNIIEKSTSNTTNASNIIKKSTSNITQSDLDQYNNLFDYKNTAEYAKTRRGIEYWKSIGKSEIEIDEQLSKLMTTHQTNVDSYNTYVTVEKQFNDLQTKIFSEYKTDTTSLAANNSKIIANGSDDYFSSFNQYGADQGDIKNSYYYRNKNTGQITGERYAKNHFNSSNVDKLNTTTYNRLRNKLNDMGYSYKQADSILMSVDNNGCCTYASIENGIINAYKNNESAFKRDFGFDMYTVSNGKKELNSAELLLDMYTYMNDLKNGGGLLNNNDILNYSNDIKGINNENLLDTSMQQYMYKGNDENILVNKYIKSKNSSIDVKTTKIDTTFNDNDSMYSYNKGISKNLSEVKDVSNTVAKNISNGNSCVLNVYRNDYSEVRFIDLNDSSKVITTSNWNEDAGHSVAITAVSNDGYIVSSWGNRYLIPFEDLADGGTYNIFTKSITGIESGE